MDKKTTIKGREETTPWTKKMTEEKRNQETTILDNIITGTEIINITTKKEKDSIEETQKRRTEKEIEGIKKLESSTINEKMKKKLKDIVVEIISNSICYATPQTEIKIRVNKIEKDGNTYYIIQSYNYYNDPTGEATKKLQEKMDRINENDKETIKKAQAEQLLNGKANEYNNAGVGFLDMGKKLKGLNNEPFTYKTTKVNTTGLRTLDLIIKIPD